MSQPSEENKKDTFVTGVEIEGKELKKQEPIQKQRIQTAKKKIEVNQDNFSERKAEYKHANKLYKKIMFHPPNEKYYDQVEFLYGIIPGIQFIKKMFSHDNCEKAVEGLRLNIPETYWNDTEMFFVSNDYRTGALQLIRNKKEFDLFESIYDIEQTQYKRQFKDIDPFIIIRSRESDYENVVKVERFEKAQDNLGKDIGDGIVQRYIRCRGRNRELDQGKNLPSITSTQKKPNAKRDTIKSNSTTTPFVATVIKGEERKQSMTQPTVVRLEYKTGYNTSKGANVAYCLINKGYVEKSIKSGSKEVIEKYNQLTTLNTKDEESFDIYIMSGESVAPYEFYAQQLTSYLQKWFKMLVKTIVCDFMKDERGIIYFLGCKSLSLVKDPEVLMKTKPDLKLLNVKDEKNLKKFYKTWNCRLCLLPYPKSKITKIVTFKLLYKLKENLSKRGCDDFNHINNNIYNESQSCRVCDLCYKLLLTEQELMEIQKTIALCSNIEIQNDELLSNSNQSPQNLVRAPQKYKKLTQWRIIFYFLKFYNFDYLKFPFKGNKNKKRNTDKKNEDETNYSLCITLFNQRLSFPILTEEKQCVTPDEVDINKAKIFYFFSSENSSIKQILRTEEIEFKLILNDKVNEPLAQCKTTLFSCYDDGVKERPLTSKTILNFFSEYIKHFKCQVYFGLKNDGVVATESQQMYCYKLPNPIYITDLDYFSYHPLPNDWYELFIPPDAQIEDNDTYDVEKEVDRLIKDLEGKDKKNKEENDDEVYDPYDILIEVQNKNDIINKINSIPIVMDKAFIEMKQDEKKKRPETAMLVKKFNLPRIDNDLKAKRKATVRAEKEKEKEKERAVNKKKTIDDLLFEADEKTKYLEKVNKELEDATI